MFSKCCVLCAIKNSLTVSEAFGTRFSIHPSSEETRSRPPELPMTRERLWRLPAWGREGGEKKKEMLQLVEAQSGESWRGDKNVSIHANWCPDPPPGCRRLLSGKGIKGPFAVRSVLLCSHTASTSYRSARTPDRRCAFLLKSIQKKTKQEKKK